MGRAYRSGPGIKFSTMQALPRCGLWLLALACGVPAPAQTRDSSGSRRASGAATVRRVPREPRRLPVHVTLPRDSTARFFRLRIISTNDFHGALDPVLDAGGTPRGGADAMAAAIARASADCAPPNCWTLLVDAGDLFQGSEASN